jgi:hypothetical protein
MERLTIRLGRIRHVRRKGQDGIKTGILDGEIFQMGKITKLTKANGTEDRSQNIRVSQGTRQVVFMKNN